MDQQDDLEKLAAQEFARLANYERPSASYDLALRAAAVVKDLNLSAHADHLSAASAAARAVYESTSASAALRAFVEESESIKRLADLRSHADFGSVYALADAAKQAAQSHLTFDTATFASQISNFYSSSATQALNAFAGLKLARDALMPWFTKHNTFESARHTYLELAGAGSPTSLAARGLLEGALSSLASSRTLQRDFDHLTDFLKTSEDFTQHRSVAAWVHEIERSALFETLSTADPERLKTVLEGTIAQEESPLATEAGTAPIGLQTQESEVVRTEIETALAGKSPIVSDRALNYVIVLLLILNWGYEKIGQWNDFREGLCDLNERVLQSESTSQAQKSIRGFLCEQPKGAQKLVRLIARSNVNLREAPGMKSPVIMRLPLYATLEVIDGDDRTWLHVYYKHEGNDIEGWVSRSMVKTVRGR